MFIRDIIFLDYSLLFCLILDAAGACFGDAQAGSPTKEVQVGPSGHFHPHPLLVELCIGRNLQGKGNI
jgi:hypothetical protein